MPLIVPENNPNRPVWLKQGVRCLGRGDLPINQPPPLRIGLFNLMPEAEKYEFSVIRPLGLTEIPVLPVWIRSAVHSYGSSDRKHLDEWYISFEEAVREEPLDGLIVTGAPVETIPFESVRYWNELADIFGYARLNIPGTMGLCWGGLAIAKILGVEKTVFRKKLFGVYRSKYLVPQDPEGGHPGKTFFCPHSRYAGLNEDEARAAQAGGRIRLLAFSEEAGHFIFESPDGRFIGHLGHPEYTPERIIFEHSRDIQKGLDSDPANFDLDNPRNNWSGEGDAFFAGWLREILARKKISR